MIKKLCLWKWYNKRPLLREEGPLGLETGGLPQKGYRAGPGYLFAA
jgi:hypothetical protein